MTYKTKLTEHEKQLILTKAQEGLSYTELAALVNNKITKQRVHQLCKMEGIDAFSIKQDKKQETYAEKMTAKWGVNWDNKEHRRSYIYQTMRAKFRTKKANAKANGKPWTVTFGELEFPTHCPVLGLELDYFADAAQENSPSFDCIIPSLGYVSGNVAIISWRANRIKNNGTADEHRAIAEFIESFASSAEPFAS